MTRLSRALLLLAAVLVVAPASADEPAVIVLRAGMIFDGEKFVPNASLVIRDGRLVGEEPPEGATILDASDGFVTPGLVDALTSLGITGPDSERTLEVTPRFSVADTFDPADPGLVRALASGVTTAYTSPGTTNVVAGFGAVLRPGTKGWAVATPRGALEATVTSEPAAGNRAPRRGAPDNIYYRRPNTRMGVIWILRGALFAAASESHGDPDLAAVRDSIRGGIPLRFTARREEDIRAACRVAGEFGLRGFVVQDGIEAWRASDALAAAGAMVVLPPTVYSERGVGPDATRTFLSGAGKLEAAGVPFAIGSGRRGDGTGLAEAAGFAWRFGLAPEAALAAITSRAADLLGVGDSAGRIAPGRPADLVIWTGDPLEPSSAVRMVLVGGRVVYEAESGGAK